MSYQKLIEQSVNLAFNSVKDLAETGLISQKNSTTFDFGTNETTTTSVITKKIKVIVTSIKRKTIDGFVTTKAVLLKAVDVDDITLYDNILLKDGKWNFGSVLENNGFVITVAIFKET